MAKRQQYSVLQGLVRDIERALDESGTEEWKLLSTFSNLLFAIEEADVSSGDEPELEDESGRIADADPEAHGPHEGREQLNLPGTAGMDADVPRGTLQRNSEAVPLVRADLMSDKELVAMCQARGIITGAKRLVGGAS